MTVFSKPTNGKPVVPRRNYVAPIPLLRGEKKSIPKEDLLEFELRSTPGDANSAKYKFKVAIFENGTPEEVLEFVRNVQRIITGLNITLGPPMYVQMRALLKGDALSAFNTAATAAGNETVPHFTQAWRGLVSHVFPQRALAKQKRVMRRFMRKPKDWTMRTYTARMTEINEYLALFPPFGGNAQRLDNEELLDIYEFGCPPRWQRQMILQDFDPLAGDVNDMVRFCERMEQTDEDEVEKKPKAAPKSSDKKRSVAKSSETDHDKWCEFCEIDNHDTHKCFKLKKLKQQYKRARQNGDRDVGKSNSRASDDKKSEMYTKKQVEGMLAMVYATIGKKAPAKKPKRKVRDADLNALEQMRRNAQHESDSDESSQGEVADGFASLGLSDSE